MSSATCLQRSRSLARSSSGLDPALKVRSFERDFRLTEPISSPSSPATSELHRPSAARIRKSDIFGLFANAACTRQAAAPRSLQVCAPSRTLSWCSSTLPHPGTRLIGRRATYCITASLVGRTRAWPSGLLSSDAIFASIGLGPIPAEQVSPPVRAFTRPRISSTTASAASGPPRAARQSVRSRYASSNEHAWKLLSYSRKISRTSQATRVYLPKSVGTKMSSSGGIFEPTRCGCLTISAPMKPGIADRTP
mmetsp:Transcript_64362/g.181141  ORF Transcript_64362/g.181141 Transcript_64362/m.181141 type:complete len:251 (-) Transcript_64362:569-1321(-)